MSDLKIVFYFKPNCGWSWGVQTVLEKYGLNYEEKNILADPGAYAEMVAKTNQSRSPCVEINDKMLADVGEEEVEAYLLKTGLVKPTGVPAPIPIDQSHDP